MSQPGPVMTAVSTLGESARGGPGQPPPHMQSRMPLHNQHGGPLPPGFNSQQQHIQHLQNLARMQQFQQQQQQFGGMNSEGQRMPIDPQQLPMGGPRFPQLHAFPQRQRFPPGQGPPMHAFQGRQPNLRQQGFPPHLQGMSTRISHDPRHPSSESTGGTRMMAPHQMMQQRGLSPHLSHRPPAPMQASVTGTTTLPPIQAPASSHLTSVSSSTAPTQSAPPSSTGIPSTSPLPVSSSAAVSSAEGIPPSSVQISQSQSQPQTSSQGSNSSNMLSSSTSSLAASSSAPLLSSSTSDSVTTLIPPKSISNIPLETQKQFLASSASTTMAAVSPSSSMAPQTSIATTVTSASSVSPATVIPTISEKRNVDTSQDEPKNNSSKKTEGDISGSANDSDGGKDQVTQSAEGEKVDKDSVPQLDGIFDISDNEDTLFEIPQYDGAHDDSDEEMPQYDGTHLGTEDEDGDEKQKICNNGTLTGACNESNNSSDALCNESISMVASDKKQGKEDLMNVCGENITVMKEKLMSVESNSEAMSSEKNNSQKGTPSDIKSSTSIESSNLSEDGMNDSLNSVKNCDQDMDTNEKIVAGVKEDNSASSKIVTSTPITSQRNSSENPSITSSIVTAPQTSINEQITSKLVAVSLPSFKPLQQEKTATVSTGTSVSTPNTPQIAQLQTQSADLSNSQESETISTDFQISQPSSSDSEQTENNLANKDTPPEGNLAVTNETDLQASKSLDQHKSTSSSTLNQSSVSSCVIVTTPAMSTLGTTQPSNTTTSIVSVTLETQPIGTISGESKKSMSSSSQSQVSSLPLSSSSTAAGLQSSIASSQSLSSSHTLSAGTAPTIKVQCVPSSQVIETPGLSQLNDVMTSSASGSSQAYRSTGEYSGETPVSKPSGERLIPPLRIRRDAQSQPQVYGSSSPYYTSEYQTPKSKPEGESSLKLVLRKSSDGTAELIKGPSFREKKRSTPVADLESGDSSAKSESDSKSSIANTLTHSHMSSHIVTSIQTTDSRNVQLIGAHYKNVESISTIPQLAQVPPLSTGPMLKHPPLSNVTRPGLNISSTVSNTTVGQLGSKSGLSFASTVSIPGMPLSRPNMSKSGIPTSAIPGTRMSLPNPGIPSSHPLSTLGMPGPPHASGSRLATPGLPPMSGPRMSLRPPMSTSGTPHGHPNIPVSSIESSIGQQMPFDPQQIPSGGPRFPHIPGGPRMSAPSGVPISSAVSVVSARSTPPIQILGRDDHGLPSSIPSPSTKKVNRNGL